MQNNSGYGGSVDSYDTRPRNTRELNTMQNNSGYGGSVDSYDTRPRNTVWLFDSSEHKI